LCNQCRALTRKYSASRHNNNLHFGNGLIVTLLDYIVGSASDQYLQSDPRTSKNHNPLIHDHTPSWPSKPVSQAIASNRPYPANNNNMYEKPNSSYCTILDPINEAVIDKVQERKRKYDELTTFLYKYYVAAAAEKNLALLEAI
jgi:hypothetical protein